MNQQRVAVQAELARLGPTAAELGVPLPPKARLKREDTAHQIAQYHPVWRIYAYQLSMPRAEFIAFFTAQGLVFDAHKNLLLFPDQPGQEGAFIDGLDGQTISQFRIWRRP